MSIATDLRGIAEELNSMAAHEVTITPEEVFKLSRRLADFAGELDDMIVNHPRMLNGPGLVLVVDNSAPMFPRFAGVLKATNHSSTDTRPSGPDLS